MTLAEQYAARRAAHRGVAKLIRQYWQEIPVGPVGMLDEVQRILSAHAAAGAIKDGPLEPEGAITKESTKP